MRNVLKGLALRLVTLTVVGLLGTDSWFGFAPDGVIWVPLAVAATAGRGVDRPLLPIPPPDFTRLEETVQERLRAAQSDFTSVTQDPEVTDQILSDAYGEMGRLYHAHHLYDPAEACYRNAQSLAPEDFRWPYLLGYLYQKTGRPEQAGASFERALQIRPGHTLAQLRLGQVYLDLDQPEQAEPLLQSALVGEGLEAAAAFELGKAALDRQEFRAAVEWFKQALKKQPEASRIHYPLAMAYRGLGDIDSARSHLEQRGDVDPVIPDPLVEALRQLASGARTHLYRANKAALAKQYDLAALGFQKALAVEPDNVPARVRLARTLYLLGDREGAREQLLEALQRVPDQRNPAHYYMGLLLEEEGADEAAMIHYRETLAADPAHIGAHLQMANALMRAGRYAEAARHYASFIQYVPHHLPARLMEAMALVATGRHREAREQLEETYAAYPEDPRFTRALARLLAASPEDGVRDGAQALSLAQALFAQVNSIENAATVAMAYAELGRYREAIIYQQAAIDAAVRLGGFDLIPTLNANLGLYRDSKPCRTPWPADDPIFQPPRGDASGFGV